MDSDYQASMEEGESEEGRVKKSAEEERDEEKVKKEETGCKLGNQEEYEKIQEQFRKSTMGQENLVSFI